MLSPHAEMKISLTLAKISFKTETELFAGCAIPHENLELVSYPVNDYRLQMAKQKVKRLLPRVYIDAH